MNDPHVAALYYWVEHDDSIDYDDAEPLEFENDDFSFAVDKKKITIHQKNHYSTQEEAQEAVEPFVRNWEFDAALSSGKSRFRLTYAGADVIDRRPPPQPTGVVNLSANLLLGPITGSARLRTARRSYPNPPVGQLLNVDVPYVQAMLSRLEMYYKGREPLVTMAYFCLTLLEDNVPKVSSEENKDKRTRDHFGISRQVLRQVRRLSSEKGGSAARKAVGFGAKLTDEERTFLVAAARAFIRRAAERETNPNLCLTQITLADLPSVVDS